MGRLREKLDDDLPELTEGLVSLLRTALPAHHSVAFRGRTDHGSPANEAK